MDLKEKQVLFFENVKRKSDREPLFKGYIEVNGEVMVLDIWERTGKTGKFYSGGYKEPYRKNNNYAPKKEQGSYSDRRSSNDEVPPWER